MPPFQMFRGFFGDKELFLIPLSGSSSLDSVREALRLLELVPRSAQNRDQLLDDRAQALLWLFICSLESNLEKVGGGPGAPRTCLVPLALHQGHQKPPRPHRKPCGVSNVRHRCFGRA